jgi:alpha-glucosidase
MLFKLSSKKFLSALLSALVFSQTLLLFTSCKNSEEQKQETEPLATVEEIDSSQPQQVQEHLLVTEDGYSVTSPDGLLTFFLSYSEGDLSYRIFQQQDGAEKDWIRTSSLGISVGKTSYYQKNEISDVQLTAINRSISLLGIKSEVQDQAIEAVFSFSQDNYVYYLDVRVWDDGAAFRYRLPDSGSARKVTSELTTYVLPSDVSEVWYGVNNDAYEAEITSHSPKKSGSDLITAPVTAVRKHNGGYLSIMEGAVTTTYPGINMTANGNYTFGTAFYETPDAVEGDIVTGWRLIGIASTLNELVNNDNIYGVNVDPDETLFEDTSWIEAGKSTWSWCITHSAPDYEQMMEYTIAASKLGFTYNIIDDGWPAWSDYKTKLTNLGITGEQLGVKQILWCAITQGTSGANKIDSERLVKKYFKLLSDTHMYGAKVDFWWDEANLDTASLQKYILETAAKQNLVIDFHGCAKNTGWNVTYPNELSREGIRGLEQIGSSNTTNYSTYAKWLNCQLYTRYLCGHADWTPATYNAMEIGSLICIDSPLMVIASDPQDILSSPAVEFIKSIPTTWDQTVVLSNSVISKCSVFAKEKSGTWFVGGIISEDNYAVSLDLSEFLTEDVTYTAEIWKDVNGEMVQETVSVHKGDQLDLGSFQSGEGFAIRISTLSMSQYGGEIEGPITVTAPANAAVYYTVDGSDPLTSDTAIAYNTNIQLTDSCTLRVAIVSGDGKGTSLSYSFNKLSLEQSITFGYNYGENQTDVLFHVSDLADVYYTLDGTNPTISSSKAVSQDADRVVTVTQGCTLRYLVVPTNGESSFDGKLEITVRTPIDFTDPDLPLTDQKPISATVGWGTIHYDSSMATDNGMTERPISLGGTNLNDGTQFERGISANAIAVLTYSVPEGVTRFVAVGGIDDCVYNNTASSGEASAQIIISFDGEESYQSVVLHRGEYVNLDVEVPEGASTIEIRFSDGGNGVTCDNVSLANPGWIK